jgi:glycosyltransferase involved in cell wall biosynthesis
MKTTVCTIITMLELGGAQEVVLFTVANLDRTKYRPVLLTGPGGLLTEEARALPGVEVEIVPSLGRPIRPWRDLRALVELIRLLRRHRPQIVHTHSSKAGILGRWAAWLAGVPVIVHNIHGFGITPQQPAWLRRLLIGVEALTGMVTTQWISDSRADIETGLQWGLFPPERAALIRPGIDPRPFQAPLPPGERARLRAELGAAPGELLVGMVACLKPQKAPLDFVSVAARVCAEVPSARFVLVGDGELRGAVEEGIRAHHLEGRVRLAGWRRDFPAVVRALDVLLLTSYWEGLGRVLLGARASRVPIVSTSVGGTVEALVEGRHGWFAEPGDVKGLADHLCRLLRHEDQREQLARNGGELPGDFDIREMVRQYERLYDVLLAACPMQEASRIA